MYETPSACYSVFLYLYSIFYPIFALVSCRPLDLDLMADGGG